MKLTFDMMIRVILSALILVLSPLFLFLLSDTVQVKAR